MLTPADKSPNLSTNDTSKCSDLFVTKINHEEVGSSRTNYPNDLKCNTNVTDLSEKAQR